jgi:hypothetical protein
MARCARPGRYRLFRKSSEQALEPTQMGTGNSSTWVKRSGRETDHSHLSNVELKTQ